MKYRQTIAKNIDQGTPKSRLARHITIISTAICMAVVSVALSVESGFRETIKARSEALFGTTSITEQSLWGGEYYFNSDSTIVPLIEQTQGVTHAFEVLEIPAVVRFDQISQGVIINGVRSDQFDNTLALLTEKGSAKIDDTLPTTLISKTLAETLGVRVGQDIQFLVFDQGIPTKVELTVGGIFSSAMGEIEMPIVFAPIAVARELLGFEHEPIISSYRVMGAPDMEILEQIMQDEGYQIGQKAQNAAALTDWLGMLQGNVQLVLIIMVIVALVNIASCSLIVVLENTQRMGVLRTLGMRSRTIEAIFTTKIAKMVCVGGAVGWMLGTTITVIQRELNIIRMDSKAYFVESLPMEFTTMAVFEIFLLSLFIVTVAVWMVVRIVSRADIAKSIKYE